MTAPDPVKDDQGVPPGDRDWPRTWQKPFLDALSLLPDATAACRVARISKQTAWRTRKDVPEFAEAWEEALEIARDRVQNVAHQWITTGVPVRSVRTVTRTKKNAKGETLEETVETVETSSSERSATLMIFWLKAWYPDRYRWPERFEGTLTPDVPEEQADAAVGAFSAAVTRLADARAAREGAPRRAAGE